MVRLKNIKEEQMDLDYFTDEKFGDIWLRDYQPHYKLISYYILYKEYSSIYVFKYGELNN